MLATVEHVGGKSEKIGEDDEDGGVDGEKDGVVSNHWCFPATTVRVSLGG